MGSVSPGEPAQVAGHHPPSRCKSGPGPRGSTTGHSGEGQAQLKSKQRLQASLRKRRRPLATSSRAPRVKPRLVYVRDVRLNLHTYSANFELPNSRTTTAPPPRNSWVLGLPETCAMKQRNTIAFSNEKMTRFPFRLVKIRHVLSRQRLVFTTLLL